MVDQRANVIWILGHAFCTCAQLHLLCCQNVCRIQSIQIPLGVSWFGKAVVGLSPAIVSTIFQVHDDENLELVEFCIAARWRECRHD